MKTCLNTILTLAAMLGAMIMIVVGSKLLYATVGRMTFFTIWTPVCLLFLGLICYNEVKRWERN